MVNDSNQSVVDGVINDSVIVAGEFQEGLLQHHEVFFSETKPGGTVEESFRTQLWLQTETLFKISFPVGIATLARMAIFSTDTAFLGHLGKAELSGATLSLAMRDLFRSFVLSPGYALNQLCSQAVGAGNPKLAGSWFQLGLLFCFLSSLLMGVFTYFTGYFVSFVSHDSKVVHYSSIFGHYAILMMIPTALYNASRQFCQGIGIVKPAMYVSLLAVACNILCNQIFIYGESAFSFSGFGFRGSPIATTISLVLQLTLFVAFVFLWKGYHKEYWSGWNRDNFSKSRIKRFFRQVIPITLANFFDSAGYQIVVMLCGTLGSQDVAAMSIAYQIWGVLWGFYWGFGLACQVEVGKHLGSGDLKSLRLTILSTIILVVLVVGSLSITQYFFRNQIALIFNHDKQVADLLDQILIVVSFDYFFGCIELAGFNILEGLSRNAIASIISGFSMYAVQLPLVCYVVFWSDFFKLKIVGVWYVILVVSILRAVLYWTMIYTSDFVKLSKEARERAEAEYQKLND